MSKELSAPQVPAPRTSTAGEAEALAWALDEIDVLSNMLVKWAYPQGMAMIGREDQFDSYRAACVARASRPSGWQPIESAPKDQDVIIARNDGYATYVTAGHYEEDGDTWYEMNNHPSDSWGRPLLPTMWMPLPDLPVPEQAAGDAGPPSSEAASTPEAPQ